jgi:WD40 repeat protein
LITAGPTIRRWLLEGAALEPPPAGHDDEAWAVAFSLDSRLLASGSDDTGNPETIRIWDPTSGRKLGGWYAGVGTTAALAFSPDGRILASAHLEMQDNVRLWDVVTGNRLVTLSGHTNRARTVAFQPNGELLASAGSDRTIRLWDVKTRCLSRVLTGHRETVQQVVFSPDGARLVSASADKTVRSWDVGQDQPRWIFQGPEKFAAVEYSADGRTLAAADEDGSITLIDPESGTQRGLIRDDERVLRNLAFSPDGGILAAAGETGRVRFWDPMTGQELLALADNASIVHTITFAPDGSAMAYASHDGTVTIWRAGRDNIVTPQLSPK